MQSSHRPVLLAGRLDRHQSDTIVRAAGSASLLIESVQTDTEARAWFDENDAIAVIVSMASRESTSVGFAVRADPRRAFVPILGVAGEITDLTFADLYGFGGDDVVKLDGPDALERRLRVLPTEPAAEQAITRGKVLLADADDRRRLLMARVLRNAGFDVHFAVDAVELVQVSTSSEIVLVAADVDVEPGGAVDAVRKARAAGCKVPWIVSAPPKRFGHTIAATEGIEGVSVADSFAPLENMMFIANETLHGSFAEKRSSARLLYGTTVAFRQAGRDRDDYGYVYNISAEGLYVRTLAPLNPGDDAWVELQAPRTDRRVRLEAKVVWQRVFGRVRGATLPPGFGLFLTGGSANDLKRFRQGYQEFAHYLAQARVSHRPGEEAAP